MSQLPTSVKRLFVKVMKYSIVSQILSQDECIIFIFDKRSSNSWQDVHHIPGVVVAYRIFVQFSINEFSILNYHLIWKYFIVRAVA